MGRRAKNKQSAPEPLELKVNLAKKIGKRKADSESELEDNTTSRPSKKVKNSSGKLKTKPVSSRKENEISKKSHKPSLTEDVSEDGWEDVEDDVDLKAQAK